jgi:hypothetical protein
VTDAESPLSRECVWYVETRGGVQGPFVHREETVADMDICTGAGSATSAGGKPRIPLGSRAARSPCGRATPESWLSGFIPGFRRAPSGLRSTLHVNAASHSSTAAGISSGWR